MPKERIQGNIALLIELLYGLAITEGLAKAIPELLKEFRPWDISFTAAALFIGLGDWLVYHLIIATTPYRSLRRLILDMLFPVLIFFMFAAVSRPNFETGAAGAYFILAWLYFLVFRKDRVVPPWILRFLLLCTVIVFGGIVIECSSRLPFEHLSQGAAIAAASVWVWVIMTLVKNELKQSLIGDPDPMERRRDRGEVNRHSPVHQTVSCGLGMLVVGGMLLRSLRRQSRGPKRTSDGAA